MRGFTSSCLLATLLWVTGCVPGLRINVNESGFSNSPPYEVLEITPTLIAEQPSSHPSTEGLVPLDLHNLNEYIVGSGDILQIVVWDHLELTNPFGATTRDPISAGQLVAADGTLHFPYVGVFKAGGMTVRQVREYISDRLSVVVNKPQVDVRVASFRSGRIQVTGEVKNPGVVTLDDTPKGVIEALNERGGLNTTASRRIAILIRGDTSYEIDLASLLSGNSPAINPQLNAGDIVHVPDTGNDQVFVLGELAKQAPVVMGQQRMSLTEALTKSGGLDRLTANDSGVLIFRRQPNPQKPALIYALDMSTPSGMLLAGEFNLQPRDVVYVKATAFAQYNSVINQLLPTISAVFQIDRLTQ
ncbi:polysaccharide biosynthesis/export family protein [Hydrocarboniphaga effusa]|uniref:polysaccharide biosynthesis/export family protein n=1 Tax=Hydrocarboniphaga effusa TaxID=243629 RepID=UPI0009FEBD82|nr:polysaccharide biosynthesis/export family protein [Hydrocarboniphaga effusa]